MLWLAGARHLCCGEGGVRLAGNVGVEPRSRYQAESRVYLGKLLPVVSSWCVVRSIQVRAAIQLLTGSSQGVY